MNIWNKIIVICLGILISIGTYNIYFLYKENAKLKSQVNKNEIYIKKIESKINNIKNNLNDISYQQESYNEFVSEEFVRTWQSFARIKQNFESIGYSLKYGLHLEEDDKMTD